MKTRLEKLWQFIDEHLEVDYGYLPKSHMNDKDDSCVDKYIQEIKDDFARIKDSGNIRKECIEESIDILKRLDEI